MKKFFARISLSLVAVIAFVLAVASTQASAQSADPNAAQGAQISPALVELNAEKGKTYTLKIKVTNVTLTELAYTTSINDFESKDETGSPSVLLDTNLPASASVVNWVSTPSEFTLDSREFREITATVTVPSNAEPGGHYGVIRFSGRAPELDSSGVGLAASTGMLLLIRVSGDITESASLESFSTASGGSQTSFFETPRIQFVTRVKNDGNIHVKPTGTIEIRDAFGNSVGSVPVNDTKSNVLPDSIRRFEGEYRSDWMFGMYTADLTLGYGTTGQAVTNTITFWVIPYKLLLVLLLALVTVLFIASRLIKVYNRHIIAKAKNEKTKKTKNVSRKKN